MSNIGFDFDNFTFDLTVHYRRSVSFTLLNVLPLDEEEEEEKKKKT